MQKKKINVTKEEMVGIYNSLTVLSQQSMGATSAYGVALNKSQLEREVKALQEAAKPTEDFTEYQKALQELSKEHAKKDKKGNPQTYTDQNGGQFYDIEDNKKYEKAVEKLRKKSKKAIDGMEKKNKELKKILNEQAKLELFPIKLKDITGEVTPDVLIKLEDLIVE